MAGIPKYIHKIELKSQHDCKIFDRFHPEIKQEKTEAHGESVLLTFSTREPYTVSQWVTILTFAGRPQDGVAIPNNGKTIQQMVAEENAAKKARA